MVRPSNKSSFRNIEICLVLRFKPRLEEFIERPPMNPKKLLFEACDSVEVSVRLGTRAGEPDSELGAPAPDFFPKRLRLLIFSRTAPAPDFSQAAPAPGIVFSSGTGSSPAWNNKELGNAKSSDNLLVWEYILSFPQGRGPGVQTYKEKDGKGKWQKKGKGEREMKGQIPKLQIVNS